MGDFRVSVKGPICTLRVSRLGMQWAENLPCCRLTVCPMSPPAAKAKSKCGPTFFPCASGIHCIIGRFRCNGFEDCPDGSDEENCSKCWQLARGDPSFLPAAHRLQTGPAHPPALRLIGSGLFCCYPDSVLYFFCLV